MRHVQIVDTQQQRFYGRYVDGGDVSTAATRVTATQTAREQIRFHENRDELESKTSQWKRGGVISTFFVLVVVILMLMTTRMFGSLSVKLKELMAQRGKQSRISRRVGGGSGRRWTATSAAAAIGRRPTSAVGRKRVLDDGMDRVAEAFVFPNSSGVRRNVGRAEYLVVFKPIA